MVVGTRAQVWHGTADRTSGGLRKKDLFKSDGGTRRSKKASRSAKKNKNLEKAGWTAVKGKFGAVRVEDVNIKKKSSGTKSKGKRKKVRKGKKK